MKATMKKYSKDMKRIGFLQRKISKEQRRASTVKYFKQNPNFHKWVNEQYRLIGKHQGRA